MLGLELRGSLKKKIGDPLDRLCPPLRGAMLDDVIEFRNQRKRSSHRCLIHAGAAVPPSLWPFRPDATGL